MNKALLEKMEKWHTVCTLKGIDIEEESYEIQEVMSLIDTLEGYIKDNEKFYQAAISLRQAGLTMDDFSEYEIYLTDQWKKREQDRIEKVELEDTNLKALREKFKFAEAVNDPGQKQVSFYNTKVTLKNGITVSIEVDPRSKYHNNWSVRYSWYDKGLGKTQSVQWNPRKSSLKPPKWFPEHWQTYTINDSRHLAYYVAWKLTHGRAKDMGRVPQHTKLTATMNSVEDVKQLSAKVKAHA